MTRQAPCTLRSQRWRRRVWIERSSLLRFLLTPQPPWNSTWLIRDSVDVCLCVCLTSQESALLKNDVHLTHQKMWEWYYVSNEIPRHIRFYDIGTQWNKLRPIFRAPETRDVWFYEMCLWYHYPMCSESLLETFDTIHQDKRYPRCFTDCEWRKAQGEEPEWFNWACENACHYLVSLNLFVAQTIAPKRKWRIVSSDLHSTVWDGETTLFDINAYCFKEDIVETWELATAENTQLEPGTFMFHFDNQDVAC